MAEEKDCLLTRTDSEKNGDQQQIEEEEDDVCEADGNTDGLSVRMTCVNLFAAGLGTGLVTFPYALKLLGLAFGSIVFVLTVLFFGICAILLSVSYLQVFSDSDHPRAPFMDMMDLSFGKVGRYMMIATLSGYLFMIAVGLISLSAETISNMLLHIDNSKQIDVPFWVLSLLVSVCVMVSLLYRSPKNFKWISLIAGASSTLLFFFILIGIVYFSEVATENLNTSHSLQWIAAFDPINIFTGIGIIAYGFGVTIVIPTVQADMSDPKLMPQSIVISFSGLAIGYAIPCITGYCLFNPNTVLPSILSTFTMSDLYKVDTTFKVIVILSQVSLTIHLLSVMVLVINPLCQQVEEILHLPVEFTWHRVVARSCIILLEFLTSIIFPGFIDVLSICGGLFVMLTSVIFPILIFVQVYSKLQPIVKASLYLAAVLSALLSIGITVSEIIDIIQKY